MGVNKNIEAISLRGYSLDLLKKGVTDGRKE